MIRFYEFWNEPNGCSWINDGCANGNSGASYAPWLKLWYAAMRAGDSDAVLALGGLDANWGVANVSQVSASSCASMRHHV